MQNVKRILSIKIVVSVLCMLLTFTLFSDEGCTALIKGVVEYNSSEYSSSRPAPDCFVALIDATKKSRRELWGLPVISRTHCNYNGEYSINIAEPGKYKVAAFWDWKNKIGQDAITMMNGSTEVVDVSSILKNYIPIGISKIFTIENDKETLEVNVRLFSDRVDKEMLEEKITAEEVFQDREGLKLFGTIRTQNGLLVKLDRFAIYKKTDLNSLHLFPILIDGEYDCLVTEPGDYRISADAAGYLHYYYEIKITDPIGERRVNLLLKPEYSLTGKIMSNQKAPLQDVDVVIYDSAGKRLRTGNSQKDGEYSVDFSIGTESREKIVKVETEKEGYRTEKCTINFSEDRKQEKNFALTKLPEQPKYEGIISGTLIDTFGSSINGVRVSALLVTTFERGKSEAIKSYRTKTNINGQYTIKDLPDGKYYINPLIISVGKYSIFEPEPGSRKVVLGKDEKLKIDFVYTVAGILKGSVKLIEGDIPTGATIYLNPKDEIPIITREESHIPVPVKRDGNFESKKAYPGDNEVILKVGNIKYKLGEVEIIPQKEIYKDFSFMLPETGQ